MNLTIDTSIRISWFLKLNNESLIYNKTTETNDIAEWSKVQNELVDKHFPIAIGLVLLSISGEVLKSITIGEGSTKFFFSNRVSYCLGDNSSKEDYGIGYYDSSTGLVQISWFDHDLNPIQLESRDFEKCQNMMIPKTMIVSSFQN